MKSRGFLLAGPMLYAAIGAGVVIFGLSAALKIQSKRLETCQVDFEVYKKEVERLSEEQLRKNAEKEAADRKTMEALNAKQKATVERLNRDIKRLRDANARASLTPPAPATSTRPDLACFSRPDFAGALRKFEEGVVGLIGEGAAATVDLDTAKEWIQRVYK